MVVPIQICTHILIFRSTQRKKNTFHLCHFFCAVVVHRFFSIYIFFAASADRNACAIMYFFSVSCAAGAIRLEIHGSQNVHLLGPVVAPSKQYCGDSRFFSSSSSLVSRLGCVDCICFIWIFVFIEETRQ